jgi:hypothetical protein
MSNVRTAAANFLTIIQELVILKKSNKLEKKAQALGFALVPHFSPAECVS